MAKKKDEIPKPDWTGKTVVCIASGPSLTQADCDIVHLSGHPVIVVNTSFRLAPWADVLFAFDHKWWRAYHHEVKQVFTGKRYSYARQVQGLGVQSLWSAPWFGNFGNSGACAIRFAMACGAKKIILLGYDCSTQEKSHWHGDHPGDMSNCKSIARWPTQFRTVAKFAREQNVQIINASRRTVLKCFEKVRLEDVIVNGG